MKTDHKKFLSLGQSGVSLIEVMIAFGLTGLLVLIDAQRQKNNNIEQKRAESREATIQIPREVSGWLRKPAAISYSFGQRAANNPNEFGNIVRNRSQVSTTVINDATADNPAFLTGPFAISHIVTPVLNDPNDPDSNVNAGVVRLRPGTGAASQLIGRANDDSPTGIVGIGGQGSWAYIRSMWVENASGTGQATFKMRVWQFANRIDSPSLDCNLPASNCIRRTVSLPVEISSDPNGDIEDGGSPGLECRVMPNLPIDDPSPCGPSEFLERGVGINTANPGDPVSFGETAARCCRVPN